MRWRGAPHLTERRGGVARGAGGDAAGGIVFGRWTVESPELSAAAQSAQAGLIGLVEAAQADGVLPAGDPVRLASLVRSVAHGAADLAATGHLSETGKGHASPQQLVDDLLVYLQAAS